MVPEEITSFVEGIPGVRDLEPFQANVSVRSSGSEDPAPSSRKLYYAKGMIRSDAKGGKAGCVVLLDEPRIYFFDSSRWLEWKETEESKAASDKFDAERAEIERRLAEFDSESNDLNSLAAYNAPQQSPDSNGWVEKDTTTEILDEKVCKVITGETKGGTAFSKVWFHDGRPLRLDVTYVSGNWYSLDFESFESVSTPASYFNPPPGVVVQDFATFFVDALNESIKMERSGAQMAPGGSAPKAVPAPKSRSQAPKK